MIKRNDLCPCGSGKKFKKCCLNKSQMKMATQEQNQLNYDLLEVVSLFIKKEHSLLAYSRLEVEFKEKIKVKLQKQSEEVLFKTWISLCYVFPNGLTGLQWFLEEHESSDPNNPLLSVGKRISQSDIQLAQIIDMDKNYYTVKNVFSNEHIQLQTNELTELAASPWGGNIILVDQVNDTYYNFLLPIEGAPKNLQVAKEKIEGFCNKEKATPSYVLKRYFPEILCALLSEEGAEKQEKELIVTTSSYHITDMEQFTTEILNDNNFLVSKNENGKAELNWFGKWYRYEDNEIPEPIILGAVQAFLEVQIQDNLLKITTWDQDLLHRFEEQFQNNVVWDNEEKNVFISSAHLQVTNFLIQMNPSFPEYFAWLAQIPITLPLDEPMPYLQNRSLRQAKQKGKSNEIELFLETLEYNNYNHIRSTETNDFITGDFNAFRRELGLPLSPFVTGRQHRISTLEVIDSPYPKEKPIQKEDFDLLLELGCTSPNRMPFATDIINFYKEKTNGKAKGTVLKYKNGLRDIIMYLENRDIHHWKEAELHVWEYFFNIYLFEAYECLTKNSLTQTIATVRQFTKWMDDIYGTNVSKQVSQYIKNAEEYLLCAVDFSNLFMSEYLYSNDILRRMHFMYGRHIQNDHNTELYEITKVTKSSMQLTKATKNETKTYSIPLPARCLQYISLGLFIEATLEKDEKGKWRISSIDQVYPKGAKNEMLFNITKNKVLL